MENGEIVIRRVGGLEVLCGFIRLEISVIRRVGGLEVIRAAMPDSLKVIRRVEVPMMQPWGKSFVIRRVGGLEVTVGAFLRLPLT